MSVPCRDDDGALNVYWSTDNPEDPSSFVYGNYDAATQTYTWDYRLDVQLPPVPPLVKPPKPPPITPPIPPRIKVQRPCIPPRPSQ